MFEARLGLVGLIGGGALGIAVLALPAASLAVHDFTKGLLGISSESSAGTDDLTKLRAQFAAPTLAKPLETNELEELFQGMVAYLDDDYSKAVSIVGKYALLGDSRAQGAIGSMYYFGKGLPFDRQEGVRWLALAATQGNNSDREILTAAINGTLEWERSEAGPESAYAGSQQQAPSQYDPGVPMQGGSYIGSGGTVGGNYGTDGFAEDSTAMGVRRPLEGAYAAESASRRYLETQIDSPQVGIAPPVILNPAGPKTYSDENGDIYTQAGPHGVVNTRTGEFSPMN